jgi:hypothetical protein
MWMMEKLKAVVGDRKERGDDPAQEKKPGN